MIVVLRVSRDHYERATNTAATTSAGGTEYAASTINHQSRRLA
jgi:hypothetical protein